MDANSNWNSSAFERGDAVTITYDSRSHPDADRTERHGLVWEANDHVFHLIVENFDDTLRETWEISVDSQNDTVSKVGGDGRLLGDDPQLLPGWQK